MKSIDDVLKKLDLSNNKDSDRATENSVDAKTAKIIDRLFIRLCGIFPAFRHAWPTQSEYNSAKYEWTNAFIKANLSDVNKIKNGIDKFAQLSNPFVPTPGQFIALCLNITNEEKSTVPLYMPKRGEIRDEESTKTALSALEQMRSHLMGKRIDANP